jgi:two-component system sensor histidine kinase PhcS
VAHRFKAVRFRTPLIMYLVFLNMALFSYLAFIKTGGDLTPTIGLYFFISFLGIVTLSPRHTLIMIAINLAFLYAATWAAVPAADVATKLQEVLLNWLVLMCLVISPLLAVFFRRFVRNILALQFLLRDRNRMLSRTLRTLQVTEENLIQQQKHQALSHMAKGLLHEIMNPVNCSVQALQYAKDINEDPELGEAIDDAAAHQKRIADIVSDLIDFSVPHPEHAKELANLTGLINAATRFTKHKLRGIDLEIDVPETLSVPCYPSALTQVFVNLFLNAASALQSQLDRQPAIIHVSTTRDARTLDITLADNGCGIPEEEIRRLTDPFYSTSDTPENLGLGLSICQTILRHHGGTLSISSALGQWTRVTLALPLEADRVRT